MARTMDGRSIFLASPGGLEDERKLVVSAIESFNRRRAYGQGVVLIPRGWEDVPAGLGRPQALINSELDECDFLLLLLGDRWGSLPGGTEGYTSGTEEEFFRGLTLIADDDATLRDVTILFRSVEPDRLADPGPELSRVIEFRQRVESSKQLLYGTFDSMNSLTTRLEGILEKWSQPLRPREPQAIEIPDVAPPAEGLGKEDLVEQAIDLAHAGRFVLAESLFARASEDEDPRALTEFARFVRRLGRLQDAVDLNMRVVDSLTQHRERNESNTTYLVDSLANIGVIARKQGDLNRSIRSLKEAVDVARDARTPVPRALAYALDNLSHSMSQAKKFDEARALLEEARSVRQDNGDAEGVRESERNLAWLAIHAGDPEDARARFESLIEVDRGAGDDAALAKSLAGLGSALVNLGQSDDALAPLRESVELNQALGRSDGVSIASGLLAKALTTLDNLTEAKQAVAAVLRESTESGNVVGAITAKWARAQIARAERDFPLAAELFQEALQSALATGNQALAASVERDQLRSELI